MNDYDNELLDYDSCEENEYIEEKFIQMIGNKISKNLNIIFR